MKVAPIPENEEQRIRSLYKYNILDSFPEEEYDAITRLASAICGTPVALINMVDKDRTWAKSAYGLDITNHARQLSFCSHTIVEPMRVLIVPDARQDDRFHDNPSTIGPPYVNFYAGAPVLDPDGNAIGTLCVVDHEPRVISSAQLNALKDLSRQVSQLLELRKKNSDLIESRARLQIAEQHLKEALSEEKRINKLKSEFVSMVSHEFRTPMSVVLSGIDLLQMMVAKVSDEELAKRMQETTEPIRQQILRLRHLISMAMQQENFHANRMKLLLMPCDLVSYCQDFITRSRVHNQAYERVHVISNEPYVLVEADPLLLESVLDNLINNGLKYSAQAKTDVEIRVKIADEKAQLSVTDYGIGIPAKEIKHIGESFFRASNVTDIKGTGLGLTLTRQFIELQGGEFKLESQLGTYTRCTITMPLICLSE